jgi:hypothetical protein
MHSVSGRLYTDICQCGGGVLWSSDLLIVRPQMVPCQDLVLPSKPKLLGVWPRLIRGRDV